MTQRPPISSDFRADLREVRDEQRRMVCVREPAACVRILPESRTDPLLRGTEVPIIDSPQPGPDVA